MYFDSLIFISIVILDLYKIFRIIIYSIIHFFFIYYKIKLFYNLITINNYADNQQLLIMLIIKILSIILMAFI